MARFVDNPSFPAGLRVIAIDHDIIVLNTIEDMCNRYHYQVTKCNSASDALYLLERKDCYDVMLIDAHMPNMDVYDFVQNATLQLNIPVIMMAVDSTKSSIMKSIESGACTYWTKPLAEEEVKIMWQHVVRNGSTENKYEIVGSLVVQECRKRGREDANASKETLAKKTCLSWSPELHQQFLCAVNQLGLDKARPKMILKIMDVPGLRVGHVASHLQKYRIHLKRSADETKRGRTKSKWSDSFQAEWIDKVHSYDFQTKSIDQDRNDNLIQTELADQDRNDDFLAEWIDCGTGSYLHNLMA
ncbi:two-component response regulator ARR14 [Medicago truncatula]|uniref:two-component response regulator ARR14 n=1 Tax=Medicago truncatula TaxID=3880 RepID=UPI0019685365|nr:two-component response regulator ARR14 [Medicago truncatula]